MSRMTVPEFASAFRGFYDTATNYPVLYAQSTLKSYGLDMSEDQISTLGSQLKNQRLITTPLDGLRDMLAAAGSLTAPKPIQITRYAGCFKDTHVVLDNISVCGLDVTLWDYSSGSSSVRIESLEIASVVLLSSIGVCLEARLSIKSIVLQGGTKGLTSSIANLASIALSFGQEGFGTRLSGLLSNDLEGMANAKVGSVSVQVDGIVERMADGKATLDVKGVKFDGRNEVSLQIDTKTKVVVGANVIDLRASGDAVCQITSQAVRCSKLTVEANVSRVEFPELELSGTIVIAKVEAELSSVQKRLLPLIAAAIGEACERATTQIVKLSIKDRLEFFVENLRSFVTTELTASFAKGSLLVGEIDVDFSVTRQGNELVAGQLGVAEVEVDSGGTIKLALDAEAAALVASTFAVAKVSGGIVGTLSGSMITVPILILKLKANRLASPVVEIDASVRLVGVTASVSFINQDLLQIAVDGATSAIEDAVRSNTAELVADKTKVAKKILIDHMKSELLKRFAAVKLSVDKLEVKLKRCKVSDIEVGGAIEIQSLLLGADRSRGDFEVDFKGDILAHDVMLRYKDKLQLSIGEFHIEIDEDGSGFVKLSVALLTDGIEDLPKAAVAALRVFLNRDEPLVIFLKVEKYHFLLNSLSLSIGNHGKLTSVLQNCLLNNIRVSNHAYRGLLRRKIVTGPRLKVRGVAITDNTMQGTQERPVLVHKDQAIGGSQGAINLKALIENVLNKLVQPYFAESLVEENEEEEKEETPDLVWSFSWNPSQWQEVKSAASRRGLIKKRLNKTGISKAIESFNKAEKKHSRKSDGKHSDKDVAAAHASIAKSLITLRDCYLNVAESIDDSDFNS